MQVARGLSQIKNSIADVAPHIDVKAAVFEYMANQRGCRAIASYSVCRRSIARDLLP